MPHLRGNTGSRPQGLLNTSVAPESSKAINKMVLQSQQLKRQKLDDRKCHP